MTLNPPRSALLLLATLSVFGCREEADESSLLEATPSTVRTTHQEVNSTNKVLILGSSVSGGLDSREAQAVREASPYTQIDVVTPEQWKALTAQQFMAYRTLIIGDGNCQSGTAAFQAAIDTRNTWGAIVDGDIAILSTDPTHNRTPQLVESAIQFVLNSQQKRTGMYIALGCAYQTAPANTAVTLLEPFGEFKVQGVQGCADSAHMLQMYNDLLSRYIFDGLLTGDGCAARSVFNAYPERNFSLAALAMNSLGTPMPSQRTYSDVLFDPGNTTSFGGTPYIIVRGAMPASTGCGIPENPANEECDLGDGINGSPALAGQQASATCSYSCHLHWCGDGQVDRDFGEQCDLGVNNGRTGDSAGNIGECTSFCKLPNIPPAPSIPPAALCKSVTVAAQATCGQTANIDNGSYDTDSDLVGCTQSPAGPYGIGTTTVTLTCTDQANHSSSCTGAVTVTDEGAPTVAISGPASQSLECNPGGAYTDPGVTASDSCEGSLPASRISTSGSVNLGVPATYSLSYVATDTSGNKSTAVTRMVTVTDSLAPSITLNGLANLRQECGTAYTDPGASATDQCAGTLTSAILRTGTVNPQTLSTYTLRFNVNDGYGHAAPEVSRVVTVSDTQKPVVTVNGALTVQLECGVSTYTDPGASATDACAGTLPTVATSTPNRQAPGTYSIRYTATDPSGNVGTSTSSRAVTVKDTLPPALALNGAPSATLQCGAAYTDPGATASDACAGNLTPSIVTTSNVDTSKAGQYTVNYRVTDPSGNVSTVSRQITVGPCSTCISVHLSDFTLFLTGDYNGGHDMEGKVAVGGNIVLSDFSMGASLPDNDIANTLVAGGNLSLNRGGLHGDTWYGGTLSTNTSVVQPRGVTRRGTPVDFTARFNELRTLSSQLAGLTVNGTTKRETWGGVMLKGTNPNVNVFSVQASAFTGAKLFSIDAPANSLAVINIYGASATFTGFGQSFSGGINQHGVVFNFVDTTTINAQGYGFFGTLLAPKANVTFTDGSFNGGLFALSLTGNGEGHFDPLPDRSICP
ncbi:choice-of-anchor A family protein [Hyalangium versicolor]|uniref:choice-of-anchor A family protein n=1 Tax=Hyalangium versicolor TaxID=2861190 RepID=UPI001CCD6197|nr:immunoglobulin-like domain-containing protein [Hyalangium versicolor]